MKTSQWSTPAELSDRSHPLILAEQRLARLNEAVFHAEKAIKQACNICPEWHR